MIRGLLPRFVILIGLALDIACILLMFIPGFSFALIAAVVFVWHLATGIVITVIMTVVPKVVSGPETLGGANGLLYQAGALGSLIGPVVCFRALATGSWASLMALGLMAGLCMLIAPVWQLTRASGDLRVHGLARSIASNK